MLRRAVRSTSKVLLPHSPSYLPILPSCTPTSIDLLTAAMVLNASTRLLTNSCPSSGSDDAADAGVGKSYEAAVRTLNSLQSNKATLEKIRKERDKNKYRVVPNTRRYLERVGVTEADLNSLSVIHISGTKGKGSTCAFTESILRHHGFKTGFFSSPHLVEVRERIRINGDPISRRKFTGYFWDVG